MKASDNPFPSALFAEQATAPTTPASGYWRAYFKSDGLYVVDDAGTETGPFGAGGGGAAFTGARAKRSATTSIATATWTAVPFNAEDFDTGSFHDTAVDPSRFTVPTGKAGKYLVVAHPLWAANTSGARYRAIAKNGTRIANLVDNNLNTNGLSHGVSDIVDCAVGDYLELHVYQDSGGALNILADSYMAVQYLGA